ncbi:MAG: A/G-specific adenine glycosylase [Bdellovibrionales bacterium]|nr:A/G-specific adenine glycosylase [Bdellovibrionales bacterium]
MIKASEKQKLLYWYESNYRNFPWRKTRDPYRIWISEIMLQQTTSTAVIPYYERFLNRFPNLDSLTKAPLEDVLEHWAGLGYYSRARNIHKAAQVLLNVTFPKSWEELIKYPGFGPYTARAVTSFAFNENVGVVDGNVIRFLSRYHGLDLEWWKPKGRNTIQNQADSWVENESAQIMNQALIEMGSTICIPKSPKCVICPVMKTCTSLADGKAETRPGSKPKKDSEIWIWNPQIQEKKQYWGLVENDYAPFLGGQWIWPGSVRKSKRPPSNFDFQHSITHHKIYVILSGKKTDTKNRIKWIKKDELKKHAPSSLVSKVLQHY